VLGLGLGLGLELGLGLGLELTALQRRAKRGAAAVYRVLTHPRHLAWARGWVGRMPWRRRTLKLRLRCRRRCRCRCRVGTGYVQGRCTHRGVVRVEAGDRRRAHLGGECVGSW